MLNMNPHNNFSFTHKARAFQICSAALLLAVSAGCFNADDFKPVAPPASAPVPPTSAPTTRPDFDIPKLGGITIDGDAADWGDRGFLVEAMHALAGRRLPPDQFDAQLRLGWNDSGLLLLADVTDPNIRESDDDLMLGNGASVGVTQYDRGGGEDWVVTIAPGLDPRHPKMRICYYDERSKAIRIARASVTAIAKRWEHGYRLEMLIPWDILKINPRAGSEFGLVVRVNHAGGELPIQLAWSPGMTLPTAKSRPNIRLAEKAGEPIKVVADAAFERLKRTRVSLIGTADQAGKTVVFKSGDTVLGQATFTTPAPTARLAAAELRLPIPAIGKSYGPVTVLVDGLKVAMLGSLNPSASRSGALDELRLVAESSVFNSSTFPVIDFITPVAAEDLIGNYKLHTTFYDADFRLVTTADRQGRYGVIVEVTPEVGRPFKRYLTLYRGPADLNFRVLPLKAALPLPPKFDLDESIAREQVSAAGDFIADAIRESRRRDSSLAIYLAGLNEIPAGAGDEPRRLGPAGRNLSWWYGLKKKTGNLVHYKYLVRVPDAAKTDPKKKFPLLLFLHGSGERGDNLEALKMHGPPKILKTEPNWQFKNQFIFVSPQCPGGESWNPLLLRDLLDEISVKYPVDPDRVYLTGLSLGGFGTWELAEWFPERFAAIVPISAGGDPADAPRLLNIPTWVFHGLADPTVRIESAYQMVQAMRDLHARIRFTVYDDWGHNSWVPAYDDPRLYQWLLQQKRGAPVQEPSRMPTTQPDNELR